MDGSAFDRLTRALVVAGTRRGLLSRLSGLSLAGALVTMVQSGSGARRKSHRQHARQHLHASSNKSKSQRKHNKKKHKRKSPPPPLQPTCESAARTCDGIAAGLPTTATRL